MKKKIFTTLLILIGLSIIIYPKALELYNDYRQQKIVQEWEKVVREEDKKCIEEESISEKEEDELKVQSKKQEDLNNIEGILKIDKINLKLPVLSGATQKNMRRSLASIENTGRPGEIGNYAVAGHRSRTYGRNFNRLDEIEIGDIIELNTNGGKFKYTVVEKLYVKPEETWVLEGNNKDREITLVTCHPMINPTHRLIIKGKIIE